MKKLLYLFIPISLTGCFDLPDYHKEDRFTITQQRKMIDSLNCEIDNLEAKMKEQEKVIEELKEK